MYNKDAPRINQEGLNFSNLLTLVAEMVLCLGLGDSWDWIPLDLATFDTLCDPCQNTGPVYLSNTRCLDSGLRRERPAPGWLPGPGWKTCPIRLPGTQSPNFSSSFWVYLSRTLPSNYDLTCLYLQPHSILVISGN